MEHVTRDFTERPEWPLVVALGRIDRGRRTLDSRARLGTADQRLVWLLVSEGPRTMRQVAEDLALEQSTVNRQVNAALAAGLLERVEVPGQRAMAVRPTREGLQLFVSDIERTMAALEVALSAVGEGSEGFVRDLTLFAERWRSAAEPADS